MQSGGRKPHITDCSLLTTDHYADPPGRLSDQFVIVLFGDSARTSFGLCTRDPLTSKDAVY